MPEGTAVQILYVRTEVDGLEWVRVRDEAGRIGWVAVDYLVQIP